jgi:hypothetical protein
MYGLRVGRRIPRCARSCNPSMASTACHGEETDGVAGERAFLADDLGLPCSSRHSGLMMPQSKLIRSSAQPPARSGAARRPSRSGEHVQPRLAVQAGQVSWYGSSDT